MNITKYTANSNLAILDKLFLKGDIFYASESLWVMDGRFGYARKIFDKDKNYLGMIDNDKFPWKSINPDYALKDIIDDDL